MTAGHVLREVPFVVTRIVCIHTVVSASYWFNFLLTHDARTMPSHPALATTINAAVPPTTINAAVPPTTINAAVPPGVHRPAAFLELDSVYGHDSFLKEFTTLGPLIRNHLERGLEDELVGEQAHNTGLNAP